MFSVFRPTPGKLVLKVLPLYLEETERPIKSQAMLCGSLSFSLNVTDHPLLTVVAARAITSGCVVSALHMAKHLCQKDINVSESEYVEFENKIAGMVVGSIDPKKDAKIKNDKARYLNIARKFNSAVVELSGEHIFSNWESPETDEWITGVSQLYFEALHYCITEGDDKRMNDNLSQDELETRSSIIEAYCSHIGTSHWGIMHTFFEEVLDLMEAKGVCF